MISKLHFSLAVLQVIAVKSMHFEHFQGSNRQYACRTPLGDMGSCVSLRNCPQVVNLFTQLNREAAKQYSIALQRSCGREVTNDNYPVVCCTQVMTDGSSNNGGEKITTSTSTTTTTTTTTAAPKTDDRAGTNTADTLDSFCQGPGMEWGFCKPLLDCAELINRAQNNPTDEEFKNYLKESNKICRSVGTNVCCPRTSSAKGAGGNTVPRRLPTPEEGCGSAVQDFPKIIGGEDSRVGAWPWIALIGYDVFSSTPFRCGGSLITARHVLTAAHCIRKDLSFVRLGEFDLATDTETKHVDINVAKATGHSDYNRRNGKNDIAVLLLEKNVEFTDLICAICLPLSNNLRTKSYVSYNPFVAGWGRTAEGDTGSVVLQQLQIPILENSVCENSYRTNGRLFSADQFDDSIICAGHLIGGKDTCKGDSGGPLMIPERYKGNIRYFLIGVVSYGIGCAQVGIPAAYTSTQHFMDWIEKQVAEA